MGRVDAPIGIHHVTGIAGDAQRNVDFYAGVLGLDFLVRTVNFEDLLTPHLYYGDGDPGSVLTFFPFGETDPGRVGPPQPIAVGLAVPEGALPYWRERLDAAGIEVGGPTERFGERVLSFADPDGTRVELVVAPGDGERSLDESADDEPSPDARVPESARVGGVHGVTLQSVNPYATAATLETLGFDRVGQEGDRVRYRGDADAAATVDIIDREGAFGREGPGTLHHVAVRASDREALYEWHDRFRERGDDVSRVKDRHFFHSLYVREPGGILFELATATPGLATAADHVPTDSIYLPERLEHDRALVESQNPTIRPPAWPREGAGDRQSDAGADL